MRVHYDEEGDVLYLNLKPGAEAVAEETGDEILVRKDPETGEVVGYTVMHFRKRAGQKKGIELAK